MAGKKGGAAVSNMPIKVRIDRIFNDKNKSLKAFASANVGEFAVHGIRVYESDSGLWVGMPQSSYKNSNGETKYEDMFHPVTAQARESLCNEVAKEYKQKLEEIQAEVSEETQEQVQKM